MYLDSGGMTPPNMFVVTMAHLVKKLSERFVSSRRVWVLPLTKSKRFWVWWELWSSRTVGEGDVGAVWKDEGGEVSQGDGEGDCRYGGVYGEGACKYGGVYSYLDDREE